MNSIGDIEDLAQTKNSQDGLLEKWITSFIDVPGQIACVVYLRGCSIKCEDCHNCALQSSEGGKRVTAEWLAGELNKKTLPTWICFQGGEPLDQAPFVKKTIKLLDSRFSVALYTGYGRRVAFQNYPDILELPNVKMLKAGNFIKRQRVYDLFLATSNQELLYKPLNVCTWTKIDWKQLSVAKISSTISTVLSEYADGHNRA